MGFEEIPHTADCALRVWAPDLASLFAEAALGLNAVSGVELDRSRPVRRELSLHESDAESLLVAFLTEIIYAQEQEHLGFDSFRLQVSSDSLSGILEGARLALIAKPVKAVTFHNLKIRSGPQGQAVDIVFDV